MQAGQVDRTQLGEEFSVYLTDDRVKSGGARLKELGDPTSVTLTGAPSERGGMEVVQAQLKFPNTSLRASLYRTPDGQIQQLLFTRE